MYIVVTCETQVQEKTAMDHLGLKKRDGKEKLRHPQPRSLLSLGTMDSGELVLWKQQIERRVLEILGPWPHMLEMLVLKWLKKLPASFRDKIFRFFEFLQKICDEPVFNPSWEFGSDISPNFLGDCLFHIFSHVDILTVLCNGKGGQSVWRTREPLKWQKSWYFKCSSLSYPRSSKVGFVKYHVFSCT